MDKEKNREADARQLLMEDLRSYEPLFEASRQKLDPPKTLEQLQYMVIEALRILGAIWKITKEQREKLREWANRNNTEPGNIADYLLIQIKPATIALTIIMDELERHGIYCSDERDIRLLVLKINEAAPQPRIVGFPNYRHPDRPLYTELSSTEPLPPEVAALLQNFNC